MKRARVGWLGRLIAGAIRYWMETMGEVNVKPCGLATAMHKNNRGLPRTIALGLALLALTATLYPQSDIAPGDRVGIMFNTLARNPDNCNHENFWRRPGMEGLAVSSRTCTTSEGNSTGWVIEGYYRDANNTTWMHGRRWTTGYLAGQRNLYPMPGVGYFGPNTRPTHGNKSWRVERVMNGNLPIFDRPGGQQIGTRPSGSRGWTLEGTSQYSSPYISSAHRGVVWWRIRWDDGTIGWTVDSCMENFYGVEPGVYLRKTGQPRGFSRTLSVPPSSIDFGDIPVGESRTDSVTITNSSDSTGDVSGTISLSGHSDFRITSGGGSFSLRPGESRTVTIEFRPSSAGFRSATLRIEHNANRPSSPINVSISGSGTESDRTPPSISNVRVEPSTLPSDGGRVTIWADVTDNVAVSTVQAQVRKPDGNIDNVGMSRESGNTYRGTYNAPANNSTEDRRYDVRITATDTSNNQADTGWNYSFTVRARERESYRLQVRVQPDGGGQIRVQVNGSWTDWRPDYNAQLTAGTPVTIEARANSGYQFSYWSGDDSGSQNPLSFTLNRDMTITANFSEQPPTTYRLRVSVSPSSGGEIRVNGGSWTTSYDAQLTADTSVTIEARANSGYQFSYWSGDASGSQNPLTPTLNGDRTITANFVREQQRTTIRGIDISSWTDQATYSNFLELRQNGWEFVIVQAWGSIPQGGRGQNPYAQQQLSNARQAGMKVAAYCVVFFDDNRSAADQVNLAFEAVGAEKQYLSFMAIDVERHLGWDDGDGTPEERRVRRIQRIREAVEAVEREGVRAVIYTGYWGWDAITGNSTAFANYPLWQARFDNLDNLDYDIVNGNTVPFIGFGGWTSRVGKQYYAGEDNRGTYLHGVWADLNVFDASMFRDVPPPITILSAEPSPSSVQAGGTITISMQVDNPQSPTNLVFGATLYSRSTGAINDPNNDTIVSLSTGQSTVSRQFRVPSHASAGVYDLWVALWRDADGNGRINTGDERIAFAQFPQKVTVTSSSTTINLRLPIAPPQGNRQLFFKAQSYFYPNNYNPPGGHGDDCDKAMRVVDIYPLTGDNCDAYDRDEAKEYVVKAAHAGIVYVTDWRDDCVARRRQLCGNAETYGRYRTVRIVNNDLGIETWYIHLKVSSSLLTRNEQWIEAGTTLGTVDEYGCACSGPHLHFAVKRTGGGSDWRQVLRLDTGEVTFEGITLFDSRYLCTRSCDGGATVFAYLHRRQMPSGGAPPEVDIAVNASPNRVNRGDTVLISGTVTPASQRRVTVLVRSPNPEQDILDYEIETETDGTFSFPFQVPNDAPVGTWDVIVYVHEQEGYDDLSSDPVEFEVEGSNLSPQTPQILAPENEAITSSTPTFILKATDPDGNNLKFRIELRRGENDSPTRFEPPTEVPSGSELRFTPSVSLSEGQWQLRAQAIDTNNAESEWSEWRTFTVNSTIPTRLQGFDTFGYILQSSRSAVEELFEGTIAIWRWNPERGAYEDVTSLTPGSAYWYRASSEVIVRFTGTLMPPSTPIPLRRGWNLIPALTSMQWNIDAIQVRQGTETKTLRDAQRSGWVEDYLWAWESSRGYQLVYDPNVVPNVRGNIEAWRGYWLYAHTDCELVLASGSRAVTRSVASQARGWGLAVIAETGSDSSEVVLGVSPSRALAVERPPDPPTGKPAVRLSIKRGEVGLAADIRRSASREKWELEVEVDPHPEGREVTLRWRNALQLPRAVNLVLIDPQTGTRRHLRSTASYTFRAGSSGGRYRFQLELVPASQLLRITGVRVQSGRGGQHTLSFSLTSEAQVEVQVLGLNGQAVRTLMTGTSRSAGTHSVVWDGRNQAGVALPPGMYQLTISAMSSDGQVARVAVPVVVGR